MRQSNYKVYYLKIFNKLKFNIMTKRIKRLNVLTIALMAGLIVIFSSVDVVANDGLSDSNNNVTTLIESSTLSTIPVLDNFVDNKCGGTTKEAKKETKKEGTVKAEKEGSKTKTSEGKCGEGKCGGAEKKEGKVEKKEAKTKKTSEGKCGEGKCGGAEKKEGKAEKTSEGKCGEGKCGMA